MITLTIFILLLVDAAICEDVTFETGPQHGGNGGIESIIECPFGGAITGVNYRAALRIDQIEFICTSSKGKTLFGPYGGGGGQPGSVNCPQGQYISSFYGRSAARVDQLGIRCRSQNNMKAAGKVTGEAFGGAGGQAFEDSALSVGARPVKVKVRSATELDSIQITYGNTSITGKLCPDCKNYTEVWAPQHGGNGGSLYTVFCPGEGVITGIKYRSADRLHSITFICTSSSGVSELGPFGKGGGNPGEERCPAGSYISSIHGRSAERVDSLGIRCKKVGQTGGSLRRDPHGGFGGQPFDDDSFTSDQKRPFLIRIRAADEIDSVQIKYGNMPIALDCKIARIEVTDKNIIAQDDGYEVIGIATGSTCSNQTQSLSLDKSTSVTETTGVSTTDGGQFNWATTVSVSYTAGFEAFGAKSSVSVGLSQTVGGSNTWSTSTTKSTSTSSTSSIGGQFSYDGPGACVAIGVMTRYKIERDNLPVLYHFKCAAGSVTPQRGTIQLTSTTFGQASFFDFTHSFKTQAECTTQARQCVASLQGNKALSDPWDMEAAFKKCFKKK